MDSDCIFRHFKLIKAKTKNIVKRSYVSRVGKDDGNYNITQITYFGEKSDNTEVIMPYGLYANLPKDLQTLTFAVNSNEENLASIGYSQRNRFKNLKEGEVIVGNEQTKSFVKFDSEGNIEIDSKNEIIINSAKKVTLTITSEDLEINVNSGKVKVTSSGDTEITANKVKITSSGDTEVNAANVKVNATKTDLGTGGAQIARLGDAVQVSLSTGIGTITSGGTNTSI